MSAATPAAPPAGVDAAYRSQRQRLVATVAARAAAIWAASHADQPLTLARMLPVITAGQAHVANLVSAYMAAKTLQATGQHVTRALDPASYTTAALRGVPAADVYSRPWGALYANLNAGAKRPVAVESALASLDKLVRTDMQLAQTHAARDWMRGEPMIVGYRRVLNPPSCELCTLAASRTYRKSDLQPIHERCDCGVQPLFGHESVASVGTTVRVEVDPELGPRLMADSWSPVGPRLIEREA